MPFDARTIDHLADALGDKLLDVFTSPSEVDANLETANLVDGLYMIARAIHHLARAVERLTPPAPPGPPS